MSPIGCRVSCRSGFRLILMQDLRMIQGFLKLMPSFMAGYKSFFECIIRGYVFVLPLEAADFFIKCAYESLTSRSIDIA